MAIDWNLLQPQKGPGPEIASISNLLGAFADRRQRQAQFEREQALREQEAQRQAEHLSALEAYNTAQLEQQKQEASARDALARQKADRDASQTFAEKALGPAQMSLRNGDLQGARNAVQPYGGDVVQDYSKAEPADAAVQERKASAADMGDALSPLMPYSPALAGLPGNLMAGANAAAQPTAEETRQMAPRYKIQPPVGSALDFAPSDLDEAERVAGERSAKTIGDVTAGMQLPYSSRVLDVSRSLARTGVSPKEALEKGIASAQFAEGQEGSTRRSLIGAAGRERTQTSVTDKEAGPINKEISDAVKHLTIKGGLRDTLIHSESALKKLEKNPENPVEWVNAIDSMIRTNTGRAAIKAQYDLYLSHATGKVDSFEQWKEKFASGMPSPEQRKNLLNSLRASNAELRAEAEQEHKTFRQYDSDPRVLENPVVRKHYQAIERNTFGTMPGYGEKAAPEETRVIGGKKYVKRNGEWEEGD